jgi:hypothetical protein
MLIEFLVALAALGIILFCLLWVVACLVDEFNRPDQPGR